jgi:tellurite resistance protein TehA-like permease
MRIKVPVVPASFFGMVIGLAGLGTAWRWAHQVWGLPAVVGEAIIWLSIAVWVGLTILHIAKWSVARDDASAEVADPVQCCFVGLIGVATMLVAGDIQPYSPALAVILFTAGAAFAAGNERPSGATQRAMTPLQDLGRVLINWPRAPVPNVADRPVAVVRGRAPHDAS